MYIRLIKEIAFMATKFIPGGISREIRIALPDGVFDFARHERIRALREDAQAGLSAKVNPLAAIDGVGIIRGVFEFAAASSFIFRKWSDCSLVQISAILMT
jgi:hypothetical protein